jgi:hypothetical protein
LVDVLVCLDKCCKVFDATEIKVELLSVNMEITEKSNRAGQAAQMDLYNHWLAWSSSSLPSVCFDLRFLYYRAVTMSGPQFANFRRFVLTGSIAAVTATGAWYGAGLKMKQDIKQVYSFPSSSLSLFPFP